MMAEGVEKIKQPGDGKEQELDYQNIPKMATAQLSLVDEQTAGREAKSKKTQGQVTTQQPRADSRPIVDAWVKMSIKVKCLSEDKCIDVPLEMEETEEIPLYIQFLVICKEDFLHTLAKRAGVTLTFASNEIMFLVKGPCYDNSVKDLVEKLKIELKSAMSEITHQTIVIREKHQQKFLMTLEENLPEEFANHEAVLLKRTDQKEGYVLIGESQTFDECSKSINELINFVKRDSVVPKKIKVPLVPTQVEFFERLNMSEKLQKKFDKKVKIMFDGTSIVCFESATEGLARKCGIELSKMLKRIKPCTVGLSADFSEVLSSPKIQENIYRQMKSVGIECVIRVSLSPSCMDLFVLDDNMSGKGSELIMNSINSTILEKRRLEENKKAIDEVLEWFKDEVFIFDDDNYITFLGVREAIENIDKIIRNSELETGHSAAEEYVLQKGAVQGGEFREGGVTQTEEDVTPSLKFAAGSAKLECRKLPSDEKNPQKDGDQIQRKEVQYRKSKNESTKYSVQNDGMQHDLARDPGNSRERPISKEYQDKKMEVAKGGEKDNETEDNKRKKPRMESGHTNDRSDQPRKEKDYTVRDRREETSGQDEGNGLSVKENVISDGASKTSTSKTEEEITKRNEKSVENTEDVCAELQTTDTNTEKENNQQGRADNGTKAGSYPDKMQLEHKSKSVHLLTSTLDHPLGNDGRNLSKSYDERSGPSSNSQTQTILHQNETSSYEDVKKGKSNIGDEFARTSDGDKWDVTELTCQTETHPDEDFREEEAGIENLKKGDLTITVKGDQRTITSGSYASSSGNGIGNNTRIGQSYIGSEAAEQQKMKEEEDEENDVFKIDGKADINHSSSNAGNADCVANRTRSKLGQKPGAQVRKQSKGEQQETKLTMEKHVVEFLRKNNANELETISEMENVAIDFCNDIIIIKGEKDCVKRAHEKIKEIKSKIHSEECSIDIPANYFTMRDTAIVKQKVADVMSKNMEVEFDGLDDKEPEYYFSWSSDRSPVCLILTYGKVENTKADAIVLPCNGDFSPFGQRADNIVKKGGKQMLHESMSELKRNKKKLSDFQIHSSELTGSLDCLALIFARIPILESIENTDAAEIGNMSLNLVKLMNAEKFRRLVIPVDIDDFCFTSFGSHLAYSLWETGREELRHRIEIHLCVTSFHRAEMFWKVCSRSIQGENDEYIHRIMHFSPLVGSHENSGAGKINVSILCDELVNVDNKVAVIVNSTNVHLNLNEGRVSKSLLKAAGSQIQAECKGQGQGPVHVGDVMPTSAGKMSCKEIYHGVLLPDWIPTGNFSLQVMKAMMRRCLCLADKKGNTSLAFPALGTGKLQYPWNKVAETMFEVIDDYSASVPNTCITDVLFVLYPLDREAIEAFKFKEESRSKRRSKAYVQGCMDTITYLETRIPEHGYRIQVLSETGRQIIPEKPEVEVRFEKQTDYTQQEIPKFDQDPSRNLYVVSMKVGSKKDSKKNSLQDAVKLTNEKRFVTAAFYINHFSEDKTIAERVENLKKTILKTLHPTERRNSQSSAASPVGKVFLRKFMFILSDAQFEKLEAKHSKKGFISRIKWKHAKDWNVIERTFGQSLELRITSLEKSLVNDMIPKVVHMIEQLKVVLMEWKGSWFLQVTGRGNKKNKLSVFTSQRLEWASMLKWETIELENSNGVLWMYDLVKRKVYNQSGQQQSIVGNLIDERDDDQAPAKRVPKEAPKRPPTLPGKAVRQVSGEEDMEKGNTQSKETMPKDKMENVKGEGSTAEDEQLEIFETIKADINSGLQHLGETELKKTLSHTGNYVALDTGGRQISLRAASMSGLEEAQDRLTLASKDDVHTSKPRVEEPKIHISNRTIECEHLDFIAFQYFADSEAWYKGVANEISWNRNQITLKGKAVQYETEVTEALKKIKETGKEVIEFSSDEFDKFDNVLKEIRESFQDEYIFEFHSGHKIFMISDSYETRRKFKHKGDVLLGKVKVTQGRRQRRFNDASQEADKADADMDVRPKADMDARPKTSSRIGRQFGVAGKENFSTSQVSSGGSSASFTTQEGIIIKVYSGSITRLSVDCIVNAANENLMHGGGVAYAISNAAGYKFDAESREYVKKHGPINVGECCTTGAGDLPYKCVIHTVGPRWGDYRHNEKWQCEDDLQRAVEVTFTEAVKQGCQTVALPAISSGIFGVPWEVCVKQYYRAVVAYSQTATSPIKEIHFVDKDQRMVDCISSKFREYFEGKLPEKDLKTIGSTTVIQKKDNEGSSMAGAGKLDESLRKSATQDKRVSEPIVGQVTFQIDAGITLCVVVGDMLKLNVEAVVCPQDVKFKSFGGVAKAIMNAAGEVHGSGEKDKLLREGSVGDVKVLKASLAVNWEYIFHAVPPRWSSKVVSGSFDYDLGRTFKHILYEAQEHTVKSIAMPLLGIGDGNFSGVVDRNVHTLSTELKDLAKYKRQKDHKLQLNIVCQKNDVMLRLVKGFEGKFKKVEKEVEEPLAAEKEKEDPISQPSTAKGMMEPVQPGDDSETCPICMDSFTEAQKLTKCGHIFCLECIQEYFSKCKPSCPNCGVIYGKVTGDQPTGSIRIAREGTRLPGYDRCGCIKVTYTFYDGIQGEDHPKPGTPYKGISRSGYLPDNTEGKLAAKLLNVAFSRKLVFTIGRSRTTGEEGVLTWNDIHHKTRIYGGTDRFAYPDPTYIERVMDEMAIKGVTIESADDPNEYKEYSRVFYR